MTDTFEKIYDLIRSYSRIAKVTEDEARRFWSKIEKYDKYTDLADNVGNTLDLLEYDRKKASKNTTMDVEYPGERFMIDLEHRMLKDCLKKINIFGGELVKATNGTSGIQDQASNHMIQKTQNAKFLVASHQESHSRGQILKSANEFLNFKFNSHRPSIFNVAPIKSDFKIGNFLYVKPEHFQSSFRDRFNDMEAKISAYLSRTGLSYKPLDESTRAFDKPTIIIGRLSIDDDDYSFLAERISLEYITTNGSVKQCFLNFTSCASEYHLFPNAFVAVEVQGDFYDSSTSLTVKNIYEIDADLDAQDNVDRQPRDVDKFANVMVFKGPYVHNGNAYFSGFDMILNHLRDDRSVNCVVLIGPFIPVEQITEGETEIMKLSSFANTRKENLNHFIDQARKINNDLSVVIVPDASEADCMYPTPLPKLSVEIKGGEVYQVSSPCLLNFQVQGASYKVAIGTQDLVKNCLRMPSKSADPKKYVQLLKSIISQRCLQPVFPYAEPFDVTQINQLSFSDEQRPDVFITCSAMTHFAARIRGTIVCNPRTIFEGESFSTFIRLGLDASQTGVDGVRADILRF